MAGEKGGVKETSRIIGNPDYSIDIDSLHGSDLCSASIGMSRPVSYAAVDPDDSADSSDVPEPGRGISNMQGTPLSSLSQRSRKRRKQLHPNKSLSLLTDSAEASQYSTPASSPPHVMESQEKSPRVASSIQEEDEDEDKDACDEDSEMDTSNNASPSRGTVGKEKRVTMKKKSKKSEVEILFSSMTNVEMAALHVRNRTQDDVWYSSRKGSTNATSFVGSPIPVSPTRTAAAVSKVINEVNLSSNYRSRTTQTPTVRLPKVPASSALRSKLKYSAVAADQSGTQSRPKRTARISKRNTEPVVPATVEESTAPASSSLSSADNESITSSSNRAAFAPGNSSMEPTPTPPISTRHLPSAKSFKATFSFDEIFCKHPPAITLKDGELVPVHSMAVLYHAKVPQDHYIRKWKINRRKPGDFSAGTAQSHSS